MILSVSLNTTTDTIIPLKNFTKGSVLRTPFVISYPGGKAINTAKAASILGIKTTVTGLCGSEDMDNMNCFLKDNRIISDLIPVKGSNRECFIINEFFPVAETVINSESSFSAAPASVNSLKRKISSLSSKASYTLFSGSLPKGMTLPQFRSLIKAASSKVILDTSKKALLAGLKENVDILKINLEEAREAFHKKLSNAQQIRTFMKDIAKKHSLKTVIITMGKKGSIAFYENRTFSVPAIRTGKVVSPVGSGDAFTAGFLYGMEKSLDIKKSLKCASACAAANLSKAGACFIDKKEFLGYLG